MHRRSQHHDPALALLRRRPKLERIFIGSGIVRLIFQVLIRSSRRPDQCRVPLQLFAKRERTQLRIPCRKRRAQSAGHSSGKSRSKDTCTFRAALAFDFQQNHRSRFLHRHKECLPHTERVAGINDRCTILGGHTVRATLPPDSVAFRLETQTKVRGISSADKPMPPSVPIHLQTILPAFPPPSKTPRADRCATTPAFAAEPKPVLAETRSDGKNKC